jgi:hydrogenase expression/formation protein HypC
MEIVAITGTRAQCRYKGVERDIDLFLLAHEQVKVGDYVIAHVGYALSKLTHNEATQALSIFDEMQQGFGVNA